LGSVNLLYQRSVPVNDKISIIIPTLGEVLEEEDKYYSLVSIFTAMPIDFMVELDDVGVDFTKINEWELFLLLFPGIREEDTSKILGGVDLTKFERAVNTENDELVIIDRENDIVMDRAIMQQIASWLRKVHHLSQDQRKPGNEEGKKYLIERARKKRARDKKKKRASQLETLIVALVNTEQFKYNYETVLDLSMYQFNESVAQIMHKVDYDNRMRGVYAGTIDTKHLSQDDLQWLYHK
jgi:hypothetical protein